MMYLTITKFACVLAMSYFSNPASSPASEDSLEQAKTLYNKKCASCHGPKGEGNKALMRAMKGLKDLSHPSIVQKDDEELFRIITNGKGAMPGYKRLKEEDRRNLVHYIRSFDDK